MQKIPRGGNADLAVASRRDERERIRNVQLVLIRAFRHERERGEAAVVLEVAAKPRPESAPGDNLAVGTARIVIAADRRARGDIRLPHNRGGDQERSVVVLLVEREQQVADQLAAGDCGIVAEHGIEQPGAVLELAVASDHEADGDGVVEHAASVAHNAVDKHDALADLRDLVRRGEHRNVLELQRPLDVRARADLGVLDQNRILDDGVVRDRSECGDVALIAGLREFLKPPQKLRIVAVMRPEIGVGGNHGLERQHGAAAVLVARRDPDAVLLRLALFQNAVPEFGVARAAHLLNVEEHDAAARAVVVKIRDVADRVVVAGDSILKPGAVDSRRQLQIVIFQTRRTQAAERHEA